MRGGELVLASVFWRLRGRPRGLPFVDDGVADEIGMLAVLSGVEGLELGAGETEDGGEDVGVELETELPLPPRRRRTPFIVVEGAVDGSGGGEK